MQFNCPGCAQSIEADESHAGIQANCPYCNASVIIPGKSVIIRQSVAYNKPTVKPPLVPHIAQKKKSKFSAGTVWALITIFFIVFIYVKLFLMNPNEDDNAMATNVKTNIDENIFAGTPIEKFLLFKDAFWLLAEKAEQASGKKFFTDVKYIGDGMVVVTATDAWLSAPTELRQGNLQTIYNLWKEAEGSGLPIAVYIHDSQGNARMKKGNI